MYHVELRQFPHNFCRFNLDERELRELVLDAWAREQWFEFGERRWNPHESTLTILQAPRLELRELAMARGWRNAQRRGEDVTERIVASRRQELARAAAADAAHDREQGLEGAAGSLVAPAGAAATSAAAPGAASMSPDRDALALATALLPLLGEDSQSLIRAWQLALERHPDRSPSECLALAEDLVRR